MDIVSPPQQDVNAQPKVSVIIPLYNKRDYIGRALDSVLAQTIQSFEVVVDDGSTDDGGEVIVKDYTDPRIRLIRQKNQGVSSARNFGVSVAQAELIAFFDADDEWLPEFLETILRLREKYPDAGLYCTNWWYTISQNNQYKDVHRVNPILPGMDEGVVPSYFRYVALNREVNITSSTAIPKSVFMEFSGFDVSFIMHEDLDLWDKIGYHYAIAYSEKPLSLYHTEASDGAQRILRNYATMKLPFINYFFSPFRKG